MIARAASATRDASLSSNPYCLDAIAGFRAEDRVAWVSGEGRLNVDKSTKILGVKNLWDCKSRTFELRQSLSAGELVALDNLTWMKTHDKEMFSLFEEFACKDKNHIR